MTNTQTDCCSWLFFLTSTNLTSNSYPPPTCFNSTYVKALYHDPSHIKHSIVTDLLIIKSKIWKHIKTAKVLKIPWPNKLTCNNEFSKCHHVFGHEQCDMVMYDLFYHALITNQDSLLTASVFCRISASFAAEFGRLMKRRNCLKRMVSH